LIPCSNRGTREAEQPAHPCAKRLLREPFPFWSSLRRKKSTITSSRAAQEISSLGGCRHQVPECLTPRNRSDRRGRQEHHLEVRTFGIAPFPLSKIVSGIEGVTVHVAENPACQESW